MAKELVLIPKTKYEELLSSTNDSKQETNEMKELKSNIKRQSTDGKPTENEKDSESTDKNSKAIENKNEDSNLKVKRNIKKSVQDGGELYVKSTPHDFMTSINKLKTKKKWLSFKV